MLNLDKKSNTNQRKNKLASSGCKKMSGILLFRIAYYSISKTLTLADIIGFFVRTHFLNTTLNKNFQSSKMNRKMQKFNLILQGGQRNV